MSVTVEFAGQSMLPAFERTLSEADVATAWIDALETIGAILATQAVAIKIAPLILSAVTSALTVVGVAAPPAGLVILLAAAGTIAATMGVDFAISTLSSALKDVARDTDHQKWITPVREFAAETLLRLDNADGRSIQVGEIEIDTEILRRVAAALAPPTPPKTMQEATGGEAASRQKPETTTESDPIEDKDDTAERTIEIQQNDTLWDIAQKEGVTLAQLLAANADLDNPNTIRPGDMIRLPGNAAAGRPFHVVQPGDNVWSIGAAHGLSLEQMIAFNQQLADPGQIRVGQIIYLDQ